MLMYEQQSFIYIGTELSINRKPVSTISMPITNISYKWGNVVHMLFGRFGCKAYTDFRNMRVNVNYLSIAVRSALFTIDYIIIRICKRDIQYNSRIKKKI